MSDQNETSERGGENIKAH